jgi:hypothetical protein
MQGHQANMPIYYIINMCQTSSVDTHWQRWLINKGRNSHFNKLIDMYKATALTFAKGRLGDDFGMLLLQ